MCIGRGYLGSVEGWSSQYYGAMKNVKIVQLQIYLVYSVVTRVILQFVTQDFVAGNRALVKTKFYSTNFYLAHNGVWNCLCCLVCLFVNNVSRFLEHTLV